MDQPIIRMDEKFVLVDDQWCDDETDLLENNIQALRKERRELDKERRGLEKDKQAFTVKIAFEQKKLDGERQLFDMKWKLLEEEAKKVADERIQLDKQRKFYEYVIENEARDREEAVSCSANSAMFFAGVKDKQSLRKRYKDLLKIYHPDNIAGDVTVIQEINIEYDKLSAMYT